MHTTELGTILRALNLNPTEQEIQDRMREIDSQGSGSFNVEQLEALIQSRGKDSETLDDLKEALRVFDGDRDGKITTEEFKYAMMTMGEKMLEHEIEEIINDQDLVSNNYIEIATFA